MKKAKLQLIPCLLFVCSLAAFKAQAVEDGFLAEFPGLKDFRYKEPSSHVYIGVGLQPLTFVNSNYVLGASILQGHYIIPRWDIEFGNVYFQYGLAGVSRSTHLVLRTVPKVRVNRTISLGPLFGYELVSFPNVDSTIEKQIGSRTFTTSPEPFSSRGFIWGFVVSELFGFGDDKFIRLNQVFYKQTYSSTTTPEGWEYNYAIPSGQETDPATVEPGYVFALEVSYLF